jgi:hypothetical protein
MGALTGCGLREWGAVAGDWKRLHKYELHGAHTWADRPAVGRSVPSRGVHRSAEKLHSGYRGLVASALKRSEREVDHSPDLVGASNVWSYTSIPHTLSRRVQGNVTVVYVRLRGKSEGGGEGRAVC